MKIKMNYVGIATFTLTIDDKFKIAFDPSLSLVKDVKKRLVDPVYNEETFKDVNLWLITHPHWDHLDELGTEMIDNNVPVYGPSNINDIAIKHKWNFSQLDWGVPKSIEFEDYNLIVQAMPAFHGEGSVGKKMGLVNGYQIMILKGEEERNIYVTGDTILTDELIERFHNCHGADLYIPTLGDAKPPMLSKKGITLNLEDARKIEKYVHAKNTVAIHIDDCSHFRTKREDVKKYFKAPLPGEELMFDI